MGEIDRFAQGADGFPNQGLRRRHVRRQIGATGLSKPSGERTSSLMSDAAQDLVDAKIAASEARTAAAFERAMADVRAEFSKINGRLDALPGRWELLAFLAGTAIALFAAILAALSFGNDRFGAGAETIATIDAAIDRALARRADAPPK